MPELDPLQTAYLDEASGTLGHVLVWIVARNRNTGAPEALGFWTGDDHRDFTINGTLRTYFGAGDVIGVDPVKASIGLKVQTFRVILPPLVDEVKLLLRNYEPRLAQVEVHVIPFNTDSERPVANPVRMIKGQLNTAPEGLGEKGGNSQVVLNITSSARRMTFGVPLARSNAALQRRNPDDKGRNYSDVAGEWVVPWGRNP